MDKSHGITKRRFLWLAAASGSTLAGLLRGNGNLFAAPIESSNNIPYRTLGNTGEKVSAIGVGGFHIGAPSNPNDGIAIVRSALDRGVNFLDNCWDYHDGESEIRMGKALRDGYRKKAFLMSKIDGRDGKTAAAQIDESLQRLQTDHVDLMQIHEVIRTNDPDRVFASGGALEALQRAQKAGKIRYIGFTGHKDPAIHLKMLLTAAEHGFRFDTVQMPLNVMDAHFSSFTDKVLPMLVKQGIGILGMKPLGGGFILKSGAVTPIECLHYAMNLPTSVVITGCDSMKILDQAIQAAQDFRPLTPDQVTALLAKTAPLANKGKYERYKISGYFDTTAKRPEFLGPA
jgi:predicted aldo/keto reductase-like oxidoreductase